MDFKGLSASELADSIGVLRSNVTHVLKARNKPSFQFIEKMLQVYPEINAKWLLLGTGNMIENAVKSPSLFDQLSETTSAPTRQKTIDPLMPAEKVHEPKPTVSPEPARLESNTTIISEEPLKKETENELKDQFFSSDKPIERLVVFFKDQTFKVYNPSK